MQKQDATMYWGGWGLTVIVSLMLFMSAALKLQDSPQLREQFVGKLGYPQAVVLPIAMIEVACVIFYLIPRTAVLGAVLLTGYLGGAVATHVRVQDGISSYVTAVAVGVVVWLGLYLREPRLRALMPWRNPTPPIDSRE